MSSVRHVWNKKAALGRLWFEALRAFALHEGNWKERQAWNIPLLKVDYTLNSESAEVIYRLVNRG